MDYEQKYKETLERAKIFKKHLLEINDIGYAEEIDYIFPELKESEDERIRKELIEYIKDQQSSFIFAPDCRDKYEEKENNKYNSWLDWLEKQGKPQIKTGIEWVNIIDDACDECYAKEYSHGEYCHEQSFKWGFQEGVEWFEKQGESSDKIVKRAMTEKQRVLLTETNGDANIDWNTRSLQDVKLLLEYGLDYIKNFEKQGKKPSDKVELKFKVGDWLCENEPNNYARFIQTLGVFNIQGKKRYRISRDIHNDEDIIEADFIEKYYHKFDIKDAKDGDVLYEKETDSILLLKHIDCGWVAIYASYWLREGTVHFSDSSYGRTDEMKVTPATKAQRDLLFAKMKDIGYIWDATVKEIHKLHEKE